jgi:hypothetical protein
MEGAVIQKKIGVRAEIREKVEPSQMVMRIYDAAKQEPLPMNPLCVDITLSEIITDVNHFYHK